MLLDWIFIKFGTQLSRKIYILNKNDWDKGSWIITIFGREYWRNIK